MKYGFAIVGLLLLAGCSTTKTTKLELTGCDHPSKWCDQIRNTAEESFVYAQIASNTYDDGYQFVLPDDYVLIIKQDNDSIGFAYSIYENKSESKLILSFRGTEGFDFPDWFFGNLLGLQNDRGLELFDQIKVENPNKKIIVTGHSLGGGIALEVSLQREDADAYVFNTSPRFGAGGHRIENKRVSIVEHGEFLKAFRAPSREASQTYTSIGCTSGGPITQHEQARLAECLTQIAATQSEEAKSSLAANGLQHIYR